MRQQQSWLSIARRVIALLAALAAPMVTGCATSMHAGGAIRTRIREASRAVQAHDALRTEVVLGSADGVARKGGCAVCRY